MDVDRYRAEQERARQQHRRRAPEDDEREPRRGLLRGAGERRQPRFAHRDGRRVELLDRAAPAPPSSPPPTRGSSTTAKTLSAAHPTASPELNVSGRPKTSPLPSTATDCHQSLKLVPTWFALASAFV